MGRKANIRPNLWFALLWVVVDFVAVAAAHDIALVVVVGNGAAVAVDAASAGSVGIALVVVGGDGAADADDTSAVDMVGIAPVVGGSDGAAVAFDAAAMDIVAAVAADSSADGSAARYPAQGHSQPGCMVRAAARPTNRAKTDWLCRSSHSARQQAPH